MCVFCAACLYIHPAVDAKLSSLPSKPKQLSPTLHKLAAAHAPLTHNCQSTDAEGSEEEGGEGERSDEGGGGRGGRGRGGGVRRTNWKKKKKSMGENGKSKSRRSSSDR